MKKDRTLWNDGTKTVVASLLSILMGVIFGGVLLFVVALCLKMPLSSAWEGFRIVLGGVFNTGRDYDAGSVLTFGINARLIGDMLFRATPLIMTGLSVALAYKTGLFNIGAPGQYLMGTAVSIIVALAIDTSVVPAFLVWILAFLAAIAAGALWGCIPGLFKAYLNVNEVITSIMTNWIAANLVTLLFDGSNFINNVDFGKTGYTLKTATNGVATAKLGLNFGGGNANAGFLIAIVFAAAAYVVINKTTFGYELRACGSNKNAARYAGMNVGHIMMRTMFLSGAISGLVGYIVASGANNTLYDGVAGGVGFTSITVAWLSQLNAFAMVGISLLLAVLSKGAETLQTRMSVPASISDIITGILLFCMLGCEFFINYRLIFRGKSHKEGGQS